MLDAFLLAKESEGRAPLTLDWYRARLRTLIDLAGDIPARDVDADLLRRWLIRVRAGQRGRAVRETYVEGHRTAAVSLFTWAVSEGWIKRSPMGSIGRIRARRREIVILTEAEVAAMIRARPARTVLGLRDRAILAMLYDTGIRCGELIGLRVGDVHLAEGVAIVRGKTGERRVPLGIGLRRALLSYMQLARGRMFPFADSGQLFLGRGGRPLVENAINQMVRRAARAGGVTKRTYPHLLRHSFGTQYVRNGGDPYTLQAILGHRTAAMVTAYMHMAAQDVEERHAGASPFDRVLPMVAAR